MCVQYLRCMRLAAPSHVGRSRTRDQIRAVCTEGEFLTTGPPGKSHSLGFAQSRGSPSSVHPRSIYTGLANLSIGREQTQVKQAR